MYKICPQKGVVVRPPRPPPLSYAPEGGGGALDIRVSGPC